MRRKLEPKHESVEAYLHRRVLDPIGMKVGVWRKDLDGNINLPAGAFLTPREWVKFGELVRLGGKWNETEIVPAAVLAECFTCDQKFADFGQVCFERALAGTRDRDSRYSYRQPGGALRAGPTLGWMAVGYDLCYDGWDSATRERLGRALLEYRESMESSRPDKREVNLAGLARGTMPPFSNHFSMQVGGAALVLLALNLEPWVDQSVIDQLLKATEYGMIRNLNEGFGDGGFFAEGDGTGSMSSQIVFLTALQSWRNAAGLDFINSPRPNARMITLKWVYQTVFRDNEPVFWPIRGGYGNNVWSRTEMSGAAYFALGIGNVPSSERAALKLAGWRTCHRTRSGLASCLPRRGDRFFLLA